MSKLIDNLRRVFKTSPTPMGFRVASSSHPSPALLLGYLTQANKDILDSMGNSGLDGIIVNMESPGIDAKALGKSGKAFGSIPWGVLWTESKFEDGASLVEAGADFIIASKTSVPAAILQEKRLGRILTVEPDMPDSTVRAVDSLSVDAVFLGTGLEDASVLNIGHLLLCHRISGFLRKPLLASISSELNTAGFQSLVGIGIKGFVVKIADKNIFPQIHELKNILGTLSAPKSDAGVTVPRPSPEKPQPEEDEGEP